MKGVEYSMTGSFKKWNRMYVFGLPMDVVSRSQVLDAIRSRKTSDSFEYVVTPNVDHVVRNEKRSFSNLYESAFLSTCDSRIILRLAKLLGKNLPEVVTGSDLTAAVFDRLIEKGDSITIIGCSREEVVKLQDLYPYISINHFNPPMGFISSPMLVEEVVDYVVNNDARFVFFAVGSPQQEIVARTLKDSSARGTGFCIGASILFLTGAEKRAPVWMQKISAEWLHRLIQNPRRMWRRYCLDNPRIFLMFMEELVQKLVRKSS